MAKLEEKENSLTLLCDCGCVHTITNKDGTAVLSNSVYKEEIKKQIENEKKEKENVENKKNIGGKGFFTNLYGE